jgi:hypothetical protein
MDEGRIGHNAAVTLLKVPGPIKLDLEVGGVPVRLGDALDSDEWRKACATGIFSRASFVGKLMLGVGLSAGEVYSAKNQDLGLFGGKVFVGPDLGDGPLKYGTTALAIFRSGCLYQLRAGVSGNKKAASHFAKQCAHALTRLLGEPSQRTKDGAHVWWGSADRLTLVHTPDAYLIHERITG